MKLKELVGYLPYELKCKCEITSENWDGTLSEITCRTDRTIRCRFQGHQASIDINYIKPILYPLSDFQKFKDDVLHIMTSIYPECDNEWLFEMQICGKIERNEIFDLPQWFVQFCYRTHIDVYGLIKKDEAVDIYSL